MKKLLIIVLAAGAAYFAFEQAQRQTSMERPAAPVSHRDDSEVALAFERRQSNVQVKASGVVVRILRDDNDGSRHQRFIVEIEPGHTVLVSHNIDLAPRVSPLALGERVQFNGEYEWNSKGGIVHWTHRDPAGRHEDGWIRREGTTFQ